MANAFRRWGGRKDARRGGCATIDLRQAVHEALDGVLPGRAYFAAPPADTAEPCLSYLETDNVATVFADDEAAESGITYTVDVWTMASQDIPPLAQAADEAMKGLGFARTHAGDLPPDESRRYHKDMKYVITA